MGNHKKFLRSEKAKTKLKGTKLKAAQNATKTDFKVRKIVLTEQLKNVQKLQSGEIKNHNINDCLIRLKNSPSPEVISNLREIILYQHEDFQKHLEAVIKTVASLSLSIEKTNRRDCFKILDLICSQTINLRPFFSIILTYLKCAMTHIKPSIQEDSLTMFDLLLKNAPNLMANESDKILPTYLDLVSKMRNQGNPERTLSIQIGNKITNMKWRKSVLQRLVVYLKCINNQNDKSNKTSLDPVQKIQTIYELNECLRFVCNPFVNSVNKMDIEFSSLDNNRENDIHKNESKEQQFSKYIHMIMPLLFETWMEIKPTDESNLLSEESAFMLKIIMDIQIEVFKSIEKDFILKQQFLKKYQDSFDKQILSRFPYVQNVDSNKRLLENGGEKCIYQNLSIGIMYIYFSTKNQQRFGKYREKCFGFIEESILSWKSKDLEFNNLICKLIRVLYTPESQKIFVNDSKKIFRALVQKCNIDQSSHDPKLELVCEIFEKSEDLKQSGAENFITQLVQVLTERKCTPIYLIKTVKKLAGKGCKIILEAIEKNIIGVIKNLDSMQITGATHEDKNEIKWKMDIAMLVYWVNDKDVLRQLGEFSLKNSSISLYIQQIISMKLTRPINI